MQNKESLKVQAVSTRDINMHNASCENKVAKQYAFFNLNPFNNKV